MAPIPVFLPGKSQGQGSLADCSPRGLKEWDTTEQLSMHICIYCRKESLHVDGKEDTFFFLFES